jgi:6-phosphogluconate dehydrogenase
MTTDLKDFGMIGLAVMGKNLALNIADHGFTVAVWNKEPDLLAQAVRDGAGTLHPASTLKELVACLRKPRRMMIMIRAGTPVDLVLEELTPLLEEGDIVIDGGNSLFSDTRRRERELSRLGLQFLGVGVSGGEVGARRGPAIMPGGTSQAYARVRPIFEAIAAKTDSGPCVTHCGADGAGHFVKMVHNGIEYADMQFIAEAYHLLKQLGGLEAGELAAVFGGWNQGLLESYLIDISAKIFTVKDPQAPGHLIDQVLDKAGQKGTGRWAVQVALDLGVAVPSIAAAVDARVLSNMKSERVQASETLQGPKGRDPSPAWDAQQLIHDVHDALYAAKICAYAQGMALIAQGAEHYGWETALGEVARIWKGGCIIRARFLDTIRLAYERNPRLKNLLLDPDLREWIQSRQVAWRRVIGLAQEVGVPVPGMSSSLAYFDSYRTRDLPQNLTQAQRDAFGSHTYQRKDDPDGLFVHSEWLGSS